MRGLVDKTFVVAGGATGIGAGTAERLASEGASVVVADINITGANATVERITTAGGRAIAVEFDLADEQSIQDLVDRTIDAFGPIHGLHNVGADLSENNLGRDTTVLDTDLDVWHRTLDVNLLGRPADLAAVTAFLLSDEGEWVNGQV